MKPRVHLCGAAHIDRIGQSYKHLIQGHSNPGSFTEMVGGAALNVASVIRQLGWSVTLHTVLGADANAQAIQQTAQQRGIILKATTATQSTASYTSLIEPDGNLFVALADMEIYDDYAPSLAEMERLGQDDYLIVDANLPEQTLKLILNGTTCKKVALATSASKALRIKPYISKLDYLFANEGEIEALDGALAQHAVVTRGSGNVSVYVHGDATTLPVQPLSVLGDVIGAGDALAGATLYGLLSGWAIEEAVKFGIRAAECILHIQGPWRADLVKALEISEKGTAL